MSLLGGKPKVGIDEFCQQFYDTQVFNPIIGGVNLTEDYETEFQYIVGADGSFATVDRALFHREMTALRLELFCFAWGQKFKKDKLTIPQIVFTKRYLKENERNDIWDAMAEYNHVIARSATLTASGEQMGGRTGRARITYVNQMRMNLFAEWAEAGVDTLCAVHLGNHIGADIKRADCLAVKLLAARLAERLGCDINLNAEALFWLGTVAFGFYDGATEAIKGVRL